MTDYLIVHPSTFEANAQGELTGEQRSELQKSFIYQTGIRSAIAIIALVWFLFRYGSSLLSNANLFLVGIFAFLLLLVTAGVRDALREGRELYDSNPAISQETDLLARKVEDSPQDSADKTYQLHFGKTRYFVSETVYDQFDEGLYYTFHYLPDSKKLLSAKIVERPLLEHPGTTPDIIEVHQLG